VVAENNPTVDQRKAEGRKKQREKMLMVMNRKILLQVKKLK
jgi:hypothetical protein